MIIPFFIPHAGCPHQCVFCDQKRITGRTVAPDPASVPGTIASFLRTRGGKGPVHAAFYGGSFTAIPADEQCAYLAAVQPFIDAGTVDGIRISTRPDCISPGILDLLRRHRVTTVELGVQSLDDDVLRLSGRGHTAGDAVRAASLIRRHGILVGIQLMPGLPGDSAERFADTVGKTVALQPDGVRLYPAVVISHTPLETLYRAGRYAPLSLDDAVALCRDAVVRFEQAGIAVIRIGLQTTEALSASGTIIAGPWHPAFGQLVRSSVFLDRMRQRLLHERRHGARVLISVHPSDLSAALGQKRSAVAALRREFDLAAVTIAQDPTVPKGSLLVQEQPVAARPDPSCGEESPLAPGTVKERGRSPLPNPATEEIS